MKEFDTAKVDAVIADLAKAGFHVTSGDGCLNVIDFEPAQAGEEPDCMVLTAEEKQPCKRVFRTDEHLLYLVLPSKAWDDEVQKAVAANSRSWILEGRRRCDQFERILSGHGYRAGAVGATLQIWITTAHAARSSSFTDPTRTTLNTMKRFLTLPAELIFGPLVLGISIELLGFLFLILIGQPAFLLSQRLLLAGGAVALLQPSIFLVMALCSGYQMTRKLNRGRWAPACWCCYLSEDHVIRYQQGPASRWPLWVYWRARLMALDADFRAPREYGVNYCILDLDKNATLPVK